MTSAWHEIEVCGSGNIVAEIQRAGICGHGERRSIPERVGFGRINVELVGIDSAQLDRFGSLSRLTDEERGE
jgi:hypothetical protein